MPERKYKTNKEELLIKGREIANTTKDLKYKHRVEMVNLVLSGTVPSELAKNISESKSTITRWVKIADEQGFESLMSKKPTGRPTKLSSEQLSEIKTILEKDNPSEYGYNIWDGVTLSDFIAKIYSISLGVRQCERTLKKMGFSLIRPQTFPSKNKEGLKEERETFKKT